MPEYLGYCTISRYHDPENPDTSRYELQIQPVVHDRAELGVGYHFYDTSEEAAQSMLNELEQEKELAYCDEFHMWQAKNILERAKNSGVIKRVYRYKERRYVDYRYQEVEVLILFQAVPTTIQIERELKENYRDFEQDNRIIQAPFPEEVQKIFVGVDLAKFQCVTFTEGWSEDYPILQQYFKLPEA